MRTVPATKPGAACCVRNYGKNPDFRKALVLRVLGGLPGVLQAVGWRCSPQAHLQGAEKASARSAVLPLVPAPSAGHFSHLRNLGLSTNL